MTVNAVLPGYTRTDRQIELATAEAEQTGQDVDEMLFAPVREVPFRRLLEPQEIGEIVAFLSSPQASHVTGQAIAVGGGYVRGLL